MTDGTATTELVAPRSSRAGLAVRAIQVRLRFIVILVVSFLVAGHWDTLRTYAERLTRGVPGTSAHVHAVSGDTEYFCPMDPGVVSEWPGKCGICNMGLVRRKTGDTGPLPSGVVARMQFSPYRVQLGGIRTAPVTYESLAREVVLVGAVTEGEQRPRVEADVYERDRPFVAEGQTVEVTALDGSGGRPFSGTVRALRAGSPARVLLEVEDSLAKLPLSTPVRVRVRQPIADREPFRSLPANAPAIRPGEARAVYLCSEHPDVLVERRGRCPVDRKNDLERRPLLGNQRLGWWCPMHPKVTAERTGAECPECGGMKLVPRVVTYRPPGQVLTVAESAVVDTGTRTVVYVERMPGMFDGVEVILGPRCGDAYPVVSGLEPGQRVATAGAFLIDAETRLNPSLAASYFGSGRGTRTDEPSGPLAGLDTEDQALAARQKVCPVTGKPLGSMGVPVRVEVAGKSVLLCCDGCEAKLRKNPEKYLPR